MLLESIKLKNFRQFRDESIRFANGDNGKNVTIIIGENGTGKTTFAQAFFWCLYGETSFSDKIILNKIAANEMVPSQKEDVVVVLSLKHGDVNYTLTRRQSYSKNNSNVVKGDNTIIDIAVKDVSGNTSYVKKTQCDAEIKSILPKELSRYFFFDGERIDKMGKEISTGKKSTEFADAVKGLLGLNGFISAIEHFKPTSKYGVIGSYENSFDAKSNAKIAEYTDTIDRCKNRIEELEGTIDDLDNQMEIASQRKAEKTEELKQYAEGEKLQEEKEKLQRQIKNVEIAQVTLYKAICKSFNSSMSSFFAASLIKRSMDILAHEDIVGKDIPYMHTKTIEYLVKQGVCICGTHLNEGSLPYNKVMELIDYLPPQSVSTTVADFKREAKRRVNLLTDISLDIQENLAVMSQQEDDIDEKKDDIQKIDAKLSSADVRDKVRTISAEIKLCDETLRKSAKSKENSTREIGRLENERDRADTERRNLTLLDEKNKLIEIYKAYAQCIYDEILEFYTKEEEQIRQKLQDTINNIFKQIYEGGLSLTIDEKYHISVYANDYEGDVETSTAQSISVIFAFITGIIKMARENRNASDDDAKLLSSEPYPLVMDAPLSAFDKKRIKTVCEALPATAEQIIIFIKDTDGNLAEEYMGDKIGSRHRFDKKNEFETVLV